MSEAISLEKNELRYWWFFLLRGLIFLIAGFFTFRYPLASYITLSVFFGVIMLITGVIELLYAIQHRHTKRWGWRLAISIIDLILGIILVIDIGVSMAVLPFMVGLWFLFRGITMISFLGIVKNAYSKGWLIVGGILLIFSAILILINPVIGAFTIIIWTGIAFVTAGIFNIVLAFALK
jgi:uncharacterized membrane protein HdeD (DUF308 family)